MGRVTACDADSNEWSYILQNQQLMVHDPKIVRPVKDFCGATAQGVQMAAL